MRDRPVPEPFGFSSITSVELEGVRVCLAAIPGPSALDAHEHERATLSVTLAGAGTVEFGRKAYDCTAGLVETAPAGMPHRHLVEAGGLEVLSVAVSEERMRGLGTALEGIRNFRDGRIEHIAAELASRLRAPGDAARSELDALALEALSLAARPHGNVPCAERSLWLGRIVERVRSQFRAPPSIGQLAAEAGVHPVHVARSFRAATGCSIGEFVRRLRLEWATEQLLRTSIPLSDLAAAAGFADQSHFTRHFRSRMGIPPARYRRQRR